MWVPLLLIAGGVLLLVAGAELVVRAGSGLGRRMGLSPLWIGLTIIALGTSAPELVVSVQASLDGEGEIAMGNIAGSNILNILLVVGITASLAGILVEKRSTRTDIPILAAVSILVIALSSNGSMPRWTGFLLLGIAIVYTLYIARRERAPIELDELEGWAKRPLWQALGALLVSLAALLLGGRLVLLGAVDLAAQLGWPDHVIGLTVVAIGTSLPELAVSLVAARGGNLDVAVGNIVGSNLLNLTVVLGAAALASPLPVPDALIAFDLPVGLIATLMLWFFATTGGRISRGEGMLLVLTYVAYVVILLQPPEWSWLPDALR